MEFIEFNDWIYKELGIRLNSYKQTQLNRRINSLLERKGLFSLEEYIKLLKNNENERSQFLDYITINVTEFFRNEEMFKSLKVILENDVIPNSSRVKIWSAGCSIGCEPYSIAMMLKEINKGFIYSIQATDIDETILKKAKLAIYSENEMKNLDGNYINKYFTKQNDNYVLNSIIRSKVNFKKHDLILDNYENNFDLIICRNVTIYFIEETKKQIIKKFIKSLKRGGLLFVGATESIHAYKDYGLEKLSPFIYKKV